MKNISCLLAVALVVLTACTSTDQDSPPPLAATPTPQPTATAMKVLPTASSKSDAIIWDGLQVTMDQLEVTEEYVTDFGSSRGILRVRVVHGRGKGVQRAEVRRTLRSLPGVAGFADAPPASGGWGATVIDLTPGPADSGPL